MEIEKAKVEDRELLGSINLRAGKKRHCEVLVFKNGHLDPSDPNNWSMDDLNHYGELRMLLFALQDPDLKSRRATLKCIMTMGEKGIKDFFPESGLVFPENATEGDAERAIAASAESMARRFPEQAALVNVFFANASIRQALNDQFGDFHKCGEPLKMAQ